METALAQIVIDVVDDVEITVGADRIESNKTIENGKRLSHRSRLRLVAPALETVPAPALALDSEQCAARAILSGE